MFTTPTTWWSALSLSDDQLTPVERAFVCRMESLDQCLTWIPVGSNGSDEVGTLPTNDFAWHSQGDIEVEHKALDQSTPVDLKYLTRPTHFSQYIG